MSKPLVAWLEDRSRSREYRGQDDRAPRSEAGTGQHSGDGDPGEQVHAPVVGRTSPTSRTAGHMTDVAAIRARLAELPADNDWARP
jgi:hypothetical protein